MVEVLQTLSSCNMTSCFCYGSIHAFFLEPFPALLGTGCDHRYLQRAWCCWELFMMIGSGKESGQDHASLQIEMLGDVQSPLARCAPME